VRHRRRRPVLLRLVERLYGWLDRREQERDRRANPEWWARVQAGYRRDAASRLE